MQSVESQSTSLRSKDRIKSVAALLLTLCLSEALVQAGTDSQSVISAELGALGAPMEELRMMQTGSKQKQSTNSREFSYRSKSRAGSCDQDEVFQLNKRRQRR